MGAGEALPTRKAVAPASWADRNLNRKPIPRMDPREELARLVARGDIDLGEWLHRPALVARPWTWYELEAARINAEQRAEVAERDAARFRTPNGVEVSGPPGLMAALADVKPLPWKWISFGALVAGLALWSWLA